MQNICHRLSAFVQFAPLFDIEHVWICKLFVVCSCSAVDTAGPSSWCHFHTTTYIYNIIMHYFIYLYVDTDIVLYTVHTISIIILIEYVEMITYRTSSVKIDVFSLQQVQTHSASTERGSVESLCLVQDLCGQPPALASEWKIWIHNWQYATRHSHYIIYYIYIMFYGSC